MQQRRDYMERESGRNDSLFFALLFSFFVLPAVVILDCGLADGLPRKPGHQPTLLRDQSRRGSRQMERCHEPWKILQSMSGVVASVKCGMLM